MAVKKHYKPKRIKKTEMKRLRRGITNNQIEHCLEDTDDIAGPITPGGVLSREQLSFKASQAPQDLQILLLTLRPSINLRRQPALRILALAQRLIEDKRKSHTSPQAQSKAIEQAISLLYSKDIHAKEAQVACI